MSRPTVEQIADACIQVDEIQAEWLDALCSLLESGPLHDDIRLELAQDARRKAQTHRESAARLKEWYG